jgi:hypothetical protein
MKATPQPAIAFPKSKQTKAPPDLRTLDAEYRRYRMKQWTRDSGYCTCFTCGKPMLYAEAQIGHYKSRRHIEIRWSDDNTRPQCNDCNQAMAGRDGAARMREVEELYRARLIDEIGLESVEKIEAIASRPVKESAKYARLAEEARAKWRQHG